MFVFVEPALALAQAVPGVEHSSTGEGTQDSICEGFIGSTGDMSQGTTGEGFHDSGSEDSNGADMMRNRTVHVRVFFSNR